VTLRQAGRWPSARPDADVVVAAGDSRRCTAARGAIDMLVVIDDDESRCR